MSKFFEYTYLSVALVMAVFSFVRLSLQYFHCLYRRFAESTLFEGGFYSVISTFCSIYLFDAEGKSLTAHISRSKTQKLEDEHETKHKLQKAMRISSTEQSARFTSYKIIIKKTSTEKD